MIYLLTVLVLYLIIRQEKTMSALTDATTKLTSVVADNTTAVAAIPNASDVATAVTAIDAASTQIAANNATLAGDAATN